MSITAPADSHHGEIIRIYREDRGWSQRELARRVGVEHTSIQNWENGQDPSINNARKVADELGIPYEAFGPALLTGRPSARSSWDIQTLSDLLLHGRVSRLTPLAA